jgi:hypothetical protein
MTLPTPSTTGTVSSITPANNIFSQYPPVIPMVLIVVTLVTMAQFGSTEKLATAFAWLIFVAVLFADGPAAFARFSSTTPVVTTTPTGGAGSNTA